MESQHEDYYEYRDANGYVLGARMVSPNGESIIHGQVPENESGWTALGKILYTPIKKQ